MTEEPFDYNEYEKEIKDTEEFMRTSVDEFVQTNHIDLAKAEAWGGYLMSQRFEDRESPENEVPDNNELILLELNKLQWIQMQILNELRGLNNGRRDTTT